MSSLPDYYISADEYLERERGAELKSEYCDGQIYEMAGASLAHSTISMNLSREVSQQLRSGPCRAHANDLRVLVSNKGAYFYPDLIVVCGAPLFHDRFKDTLTNPTLVIEILSPSTELFDRTKKFAHYWRIESLKDYLLISQDRLNVELYTKRSNHDWNFIMRNQLEDTLDIVSIGCSLRLSDIYEGVDFPEEPERDDVQENAL